MAIKAIHGIITLSPKCWAPSKPSASRHHPMQVQDIAVKVVPYNGYGCLDTLYARLSDTLTITANAGRDTLSCNQRPIIIGANAKPGLVYSWSPAEGLSDPDCKSHGCS